MSWLVKGQGPDGKSWDMLFASRLLVRESIKLSYRHVPSTIKLLWPPSEVRMTFTVTTDDRISLITADLLHVNISPQQISECI